MNRPTHPADSEYDRLASPLKNAGQFIEAEQEELLSEERTILEGTSFKRRESRPPRRGTQTIRVGELTIIAGKTTPVLSCNSAAGFSCFMAMPFIGGFTTSDGPLYDEVSAGDIYFNQSYYGTSTIGYLSSLFFALDRKRLDRAMRTISGGESCNALATSLIIRDGRCSRSKKRGGAGRLWSLISWIDQLYGESTYMPSCLGLDDQFYRLLALSLLETAGKAEAIAQHWTPAATSWSSPLDDLVDYIRTNSHLKLTLTDLEQNSGYSARHLQVLFKDKFDCTPMQFVRRQRLSAAMQKLQIADWESSVTTIARDCGYRYTSQFSSDFLKEFGVKPSTVLRSTRR